MQTWLLSAYAVCIGLFSVWLGLLGILYAHHRAVAPLAVVAWSPGSFGHDGRSATVRRYIEILGYVLLLCVVAWATPVQGTFSYASDQATPPGASIGDLPGDAMFPLTCKSRLESGYRTKDGSAVEVTGPGPRR